MFLSKQKKGGIVYLYLIESSYDRETHTRRKKIVKSFGQYEAFAKEHPDELMKLEDEYGDQKKKAQQVREKSITDFSQMSSIICINSQANVWNKNRK